MYNRQDDQPLDSKEGQMIEISKILEMAAMTVARQMFGNDSEKEIIPEASGFFVARTPSGIPLTQLEADGKNFFLCQDKI